MNRQDIGQTGGEPSADGQPDTVGSGHRIKGEQLVDLAEVIGGRNNGDPSREPRSSLSGLGANRTGQNDHVGVHEVGRVGAIAANLGGHGFDHGGYPGDLRVTHHDIDHRRRGGQLAGDSCAGGANTHHHRPYRRRSHSGHLRAREFPPTTARNRWRSGVAQPENTSDKTGNTKRNQRTAEQSQHEASRSKPVPVGAGGIVGLAGIEPATSPLSGVRSNRLSYSPDRVVNATRWWSAEPLQTVPVGVTAG